MTVQSKLLLVSLYFSTFLKVNRVNSFLLKPIFRWCTPFFHSFLFLFRPKWEAKMPDSDWREAVMAHLLQILTNRNLRSWYVFSPLTSSVTRVLRLSFSFVGLFVSFLVWLFLFSSEGIRIQCEYPCSSHSFPCQLLRRISCFMKKLVGGWVWVFTVLAGWIIYETGEEFPV